MAGRQWAYSGLIAGLVVLHFLLHLGFGLGASAPDLLTVAVLLGARRLGGGGAALLGLGLGLLRDALSIAAFGADMVVLTVLGYLGSRSRDLVVGESILFAGAYLFVGVWLHALGWYLLGGTVGGAVSITGLLLEAPVAAAYAALAGMAALLVYRSFTGER